LGVKLPADAKSGSLIVIKDRLGEWTMLPA